MAEPKAASRPAPARQPAARVQPTHAEPGRREAPQANRLWRAMALTPPTGSAAASGEPAERRRVEASAAAMRSSRAEPLAAPQAGRFGAALDAPVEQARIHTDAAADAAATAVGARAVTRGRDIYFAAGQYAPGTHAGDALLAHELTHAVHHAGTAAGAGAPRLSDPGDAAEREAARAERVAVPAAPVAAQPAAAPAAPAAAGTVMHRQPAQAPDPPTMRMLVRPAINDDIDLQGRGVFEPDFLLGAYIALDVVPLLVNFKFGDLGHGSIPVTIDEHGRFQSVGLGHMRLHFQGLGDEDTAMQPQLAFHIKDDHVLGVFGGVPDDVAGGGAETIRDALNLHGASRLMEWRGIEHLAMQDGPGRLEGGHLVLTPRSFDYDLAGAFSGHGHFGVIDGTVVFDADATLDVPGLQGSRLGLARDAGGQLSGTARVPVRLAGLRGELLASFGRGVLDIRGTATLTRPNYDGTVTLMVTDEASAWGAVNGELARWGPAAVGLPAPALGPTAGGDAAAAPAAPRHAVAGWGLVDFRYKRWLHGSAQVIVDPNGDITSLGRVRVPDDIEVMAEKSWSRRRIAGMGGSVKVASVWDIVSVRIGAEGEIGGRASVGPLHLRELHAAGAFSTRPGFPNQLAVGGTLELRAGAQLDVRLRGYISAEAQVPVVGEVTERARFEIARTTLVLEGTAQVEAYASAEAAIHRTQPAGGGEAEYGVSGTLAAGGSMSFTFSGGVDVDIPFHSTRVLTFQDRHYTFGRLHGSVRFRNFRLGTDEPPELRVGRDGEGLGARDLYRAIIDDGTGIPDQPGPEDDAATWTPSGTGDAVGPEGEDPDPPVIPSDPHFGQPTVPPQAAPAAVVAPAGDAGDAVTPAGAGDAGPPPDAGVADAGPVDAGGPPPVAGVPEPPEPMPEAPAEPVVPDSGWRDRDVPFEMEGVPHHLTLTPGTPPLLLMASEPGRLVLKLQRKRDDLHQRIVGNPGAPPILADQRSVLDELITEAQAVESEATRLGYGDRFYGTVPGLRPLADRLARFARQFDWRDLDSFLPSEPSVTVEPGEAAPPPGAAEVLGKPFPEFLAAVDAMPAAQALPLLREQRRYYNQEIGDLNNYLRSRPSGETARRMGDRRAELLRRIVEIDRRMRLAQDTLSPDGRPDLPCFAPETRVLTPDGARAIGSLRAGDAVLAADADGAPVPGRVVQVHRRMTLRYVVVRAADVAVRATGGHRFWVEERAGWVAAAELAPGLHLRLSDGRKAAIDEVAVEDAPGAPTVDLTVAPHPAYFVGAGVLVHNVPATRHYADRWVNPDGSRPSPGPFKIYLATNPNPGVTPDEWRNCVYVGQTAQSRGKREADHQAEARTWLAAHPDVPDGDALKRYYRFKATFHLDVIADGLMNKDQASWLEQGNIDHERGRREVMNRREELVSSGPDVRARIVADRLVRASGMCP